MNIIVKPYGSEFCYCRPDTTWERENKDLYSPECVKEWLWTPVIFARISKPGKCISPKFVSRYYDGVNFGVLLYGRLEGCSGADTIAFGSGIDHTSLLPLPLYNPVVLSCKDNRFELRKDGKILFSIGNWAEIQPLIEDAICKASALTSLRIGDFVAVELAGPAAVGGECAVTVADEAGASAVTCKCGSVAVVGEGAAVALADEGAAGKGCRLQATVCGNETINMQIIF